MPAPPQPPGATITHLPLPGKAEPSAAAAFSVADYLQLAGLSRRSVVVQIRDEGRLIGRILIEHGQPRFAEDRFGKGELAFRRLALLEKAEVTCELLSGVTFTPNLSGSLEFLLVSAAQAEDERLRPSLRPHAPAGARKPPLSSLVQIQQPRAELGSVSRTSEQSGVHGAQATRTSTTAGPPESARVPRAATVEAQPVADVVALGSLREVLTIFTEYFGPAARLVFKQQLGNFGVTAHSLPRGELTRFVLELAKLIPSAHEQAAFVSAVQAYREKTLT